MTESDLYQDIIRPLLKKKGILFYRFEFPRIPDLYLTKNSNVLWGEFKCVNHKSKIVKPDWRPGQLSWIRQHALYGSKNICLILYYIGTVYFLEPKKEYKQEELVCRMKNYLKTLNR